MGRLVDIGDEAKVLRPPVRQFASGADKGVDQAIGAVMRSTALI
jgi:hypothetical protein